MFYLFLVIICGALITIATRVAESRISSKMGMISVNYMTCFLGMGAVMGYGNILPGMQLEGWTQTLALAGLTGFLYMAALLMLQINIQKSGVILSSVFQKMGLLVTVVMSILFFGEEPNMIQFIGFVLAIAAIILMNYEKGRLKESFKPMLLLLLLVDGSAMAMLKVYNAVGSAQLSDHFLFFNFFFASLFALAVMVWKKQRIGIPEIIHGISIGVPNFLAARFLMMALTTVPAIIAYPTKGVGVILVVSLAGIVLFKERLSKQQWFAMILVLGAIALLNI